jgi:hypothetical protein
MIDFAAVQGDNYEHTPWPKTYTSDNFTLFEGPWPRSGSLASCRLRVSGSTAGGAYQPCEVPETDEDH